MTRAITIIKWRLTILKLTRTNIGGIAVIAIAAENNLKSLNILILYSQILP